MTDQLEALLQSSVKPDLFPPNSRYYGVAAMTIDAPDGHTITFLRRRIVPQPERFATVRWHRVVRTERPDTIAATEFGDPEMSWLLCDANGVMWPHELVDEPGDSVRITLSVDVPGTPVH